MRSKRPSGSAFALEVVANFVFGPEGADLSTTEKLIAFTIASHFNGRTGRMNPGDGAIAKRAKVDLRTVARAVSKLGGLFHVERGISPPGQSRRSTSYTFKSPGSNEDPRPSTGSQTHDPRPDAGSQEDSTPGEDAGRPPVWMHTTPGEDAHDPRCDAPLTRRRNKEIEHGVENTERKALPRPKKAAAAATPSERTNAVEEPTATEATKATATNTTNTTNAVAERYLLAFNDTHGTHHAMTPRLKARVDACLKANPPYSADALVSAAIMSWFDANDWYAQQDPTYPLLFRTEGKSHLDELLAKIVPSDVKPPKKLVELVKAHRVGAYFNAKTRRPAQGLKNVEAEAT